MKRGESGNNRRRGRRAPGQATRASDPTGKASQLDVLIAPVAPADVESVIALARLVWQQTYPGIITQEQIDFMLEQRYSRQRLLEELTMP